MYSTAVYVYLPRQIVVLLSGTSSRRFQQVYSKDLTLHKGVDNKIQFKFLNQEQKAVDITDKEITCRIIKYDGSAIILQKSLSLDLPLTGLASLVVTSNELDSIDTQRCYYSLEIPDGQFDFPVFVDDEAGARGVISIRDSVMPFFQSSTITGFTSHPEPSPSQPLTYSSSVIDTQDANSLTIQVAMSEFTGTVVLQGATSSTSGSWYDIETVGPLTDSSDPIMLNVSGVHPWLRVQAVSSTAGSLTRIYTR